MESNTESEEILKLFYNGDSERATKVLYQKLYPIVRKYIVSNGGSKEDAFDMFQDSLVSVYKLVSSKTYDNKYNILGFVYNLTLNKWFNKIKKDTKIKFIEELQNYDYGFEPLIKENNVYLDNEEALLNDFFTKIGCRCKELLTYTIFKELSLEDVMLRMEFTSLAAVKMQHKRCKEKVMEEMVRNPKLLEKLRNN